MATEHHIRIEGPADATPETAAIRLIAQLPTEWSATVDSCAGSTATLTLTTPELPPASVTTAVDAVLTGAALRGWHRH
ncbi:hypothetical protein ABZZ17_36495 [Streptomyces sp. NPDC006512]|uniref:hypothetical protein n=1 Tax=Streptomyces sp. NPDC006512 TaxID=3154307 RepID=UPI0033B2BB7C